MGFPSISAPSSCLQKFILDEVDPTESLYLEEEGGRFDLFQFQCVMMNPSISSIKLLVQMNKNFDFNTPDEQGMTILAAAIFLRDIPVIEFILDLRPNLIDLSCELFDLQGNSHGVKSYLSLAAETSPKIFQLFLDRSEMSSAANEKRRELLKKMSSAAISVFNRFSNANQLEITMVLQLWNSRYPHPFGGKPYDLSVRVVLLCEWKRRNPKLKSEEGLHFGKQYLHQVTAAIPDLRNCSQKFLCPDRALKR